MKISRNSQWYKFVNTWDSAWDVTDLCSLFRAVVRGVIKMLFVGTMLGIAGVGMVAIPLSWYCGWRLDQESVVTLLFMGFGATGYTVTIAVVIVWVTAKPITTYQKYQAERNKSKPKEVGVITQWIRDRKQKMCTLVEFTDD